MHSVVQNSLFSSFSQVFMPCIKVTKCPDYAVAIIVLSHKPSPHFPPRSHLYFLPLKMYDRTRSACSSCLSCLTGTTTENNAKPCSSATAVTLFSPDHIYGLYKSAHARNLFRSFEVSLQMLEKAASTSDVKDCIKDLRHQIFDFDFFKTKMILL